MVEKEDKSSNSSSNINNNNNIENTMNNIERNNKYNIFKKKKSKTDSIEDSNNNNNNSNNNNMNNSNNNNNNNINNNNNNNNNNNSMNSLKSAYISSPNLSENSYCTNNKSLKSETSIINIETLFKDDVSEPNSNEGINKDEDEDEFEVPELVDYSEMIINILYPVCITMIIVVLAIRAISTSSTKVQTTADLSNNSNSADSNGGAEKMVFDSIVNSLIFLAVIILSTTIMVVLYKFKMMRALYAWLMGTSILLLGVFGGFLFLILLAYLNLGLDYITFVIVIWNFSVGGIVCIFWYSPKIFNQGYLISISVLMALFFSRLPDWTTWGILSIVSIYDIFAVLCPGGPLKILIETAKKRNEPIPAMVYNASIYIGMITIENNTDDENDNNSMDSSDNENHIEILEISQPHPTNNNNNRIVSNNDGSISPPPPIPNHIKLEKERQLQLKVQQSPSSSSSQINSPQLKKSLDINNHNNNSHNIINNHTINNFNINNNTTTTTTTTNTNINNNNNNNNNDNININGADETNDDVVSNVDSNVDSISSEPEPKNKQSIRLGLGDFVFYSVLIGKAASYQITTVFTVFIAIITGLFLTLILLAVFKKALPALPMSIILGIIVFFLTFEVLIEYIYFLGENQIFV